MDQKLPLVSIVTPSFNKGRFIEETILNVKNQTYSRIEHIVIDGGSTDGTLDILRKYSDSIIWISEPDKGQSDAINKGWRMARGEILAYLNADDTYMTRAVETAVDFLFQNPDVDMVYGDCNIIDERGQTVSKYPATEFDLLALICGVNMVSQPTVFFQRRVLEKVGYLDTALHLTMDYDFWIRTALKCKIKYIPKLLANFRMCAGSKTMERSPEFTYDILYTLRKLFSRTALPREIKALRRGAYGGFLLAAAVQDRSMGQLREARKHLMAAFMVDPRFFLTNLWPWFYLATSFLGVSVNRMVFKWARSLMRTE
jgi:glycosyltransferase involved in cell wall biosynthesis